MFGDPLVGTVKACQILNASLHSVSSASTVAGDLSGLDFGFNFDTDAGMAQGKWFRPALDAAMVLLTPATHTSSPVAAINAMRPPALMVIASLPNCPHPDARKDRGPCSQRGEKWESSGNTGRNRGTGSRVRGAATAARASG